MKTFGTFCESKAMSVLGSKNNGRTLVDKNEQFSVQLSSIDGNTLSVFNIDEQGNAVEHEIPQESVLFYGPSIEEVYMFLKNGRFYKTFLDEHRT